MGVFSFHSALLQLGCFTGGEERVSQFFTKMASILKFSNKLDTPYAGAVVPVVFSPNRIVEMA
jgi:hypothetical protein